MTTWTGYKVHLTETCDEGAYLITDVQTTPGTTTDREVTATIHDTLAQRKRLPREQLLDAGYLDADLLVESAQEDGMDLVDRPANSRNPTPINSS
jgi:transposase